MDVSFNAADLVNVSSRRVNNPATQIVMDQFIELGRERGEAALGVPNHVQRDFAVKVSGHGDTHAGENGSSQTARSPVNGATRGIMTCTFKPMTDNELADLRQRTVALAKEWGVHLDRLDTQAEKTRPLVNA
jgi:hypothetical protein